MSSSSAPLLPGCYPVLSDTKTTASQIVDICDEEYYFINSHEIKFLIRTGPFVYCLEQQDNGENLAALRMAPDAAVEEKAPAEGLPGDLPELDVSGCRIVSTGVDDAELYADCALRTEPCMLHAVPYGLWGNRTPGEMRVWVDTTIS